MIKHFLFYYKLSGRFVIVVSAEEVKICRDGEYITSDVKEAAIQKFMKYMRIDAREEYAAQFGGFDCTEIEII